MIELARHIEILLLENDCVIVPDLGGFIAHYQPARYVREENRYLPPVRTIGFNPQLTLNDGLLVQSYMQAHHTDFPDATRMIAEEVAALKEDLYTSGCAEMHGIGVLHYNVQGTYEFHPNEDGALSPSLYGLGSFSINRLEYLTAATSATVRELRPHKESAKRSFRINRQWVGNAVAAAAAILLFFFLSVPVENTYIDKGNYASLGTDGLFDAIRSQSLATTWIAYPQQPQQKHLRNNQNTLKPVTVKTEKVAPRTAKSETTDVKVGVDASKTEAISVKAEVPFKKTEVMSKQTEVTSKKTEATSKKTETMLAKAEATPVDKAVAASKRTAAEKPAPVAQAAPATKTAATEKAATKANRTESQSAAAAPKNIHSAAGKYCIIVSSLPSEKDAREVLNGYKRQGFGGACIIEGGGRYRIALQRFADKSAAYQKLNEVRKNEVFKGAWILTQK